jgi:lysophospholipase L1-like esterase
VRALSLDELEGTGHNFGNSVPHPGAGLASFIELGIQRGACAWVRWVDLSRWFIQPHRMKSSSISRRHLLQGAAAVGALGAFGQGRVSAQAKADSESLLEAGSVILFQGDSITDAGRKKDVLEANDSGALGRGYPALVAGELLADHADLGLKIYNRGISGNKVPDLAGRWQKDCLDLKPDVLSILIGINDIWHTIAFGSKYQGTLADYREGYRKLIRETLAALPDIRIVICEPFTTREKFASKEGKTAADYAVVAKELADEFKLTFVPFQAEFDKACEAADPKFWLGDGIHPSPAGHALMGQAWRRAVGI